MRPQATAALAAQERARRVPGVSVTEAGGSQTIPGRVFMELDIPIQQYDDDSARAGRARQVNEWWSRVAAQIASSHYSEDWTCSPVVQAILNERTTGRRDEDWLDWVKSRLPGPPGRAASIGCGAGALEREAVRRGLCSSIVGFDVAEGAIEVARREARGLPIEYRLLDVQTDEIDGGPYDVLFCVSVLHHIRELAPTLYRMARCLKDGGLLVLSEYAGPSRLQWTPARMKRVTDIYSFLPPAYRFNVLRGGTELYPRRFDLPEMIEADPSEAVRSAEMLDVVGWYFERIEGAARGGSLLNPLMSGIAGNFSPDAPPDVAFIELAAILEEMLLESGALEPDFVLEIYRKRPEPLIPAGGPASDADRSARILRQEVEILALLDERRERDRKYGELESRFLEAVARLEATGPEAAEIKTRIEAARGRKCPTARAVTPPARRPGTPRVFENEPMMMFASPDARASEAPRDCWRRWVEEMTGVGAGEITLAGGRAQAGGFTVAAGVPGASEEFFERVLSRLPRGCAVRRGPLPAIKEAADPPRDLSLVATRRFTNAHLVLPPEMTGAMAGCLHRLFAYACSEAAALGIAGPALEVRIYAHDPPAVLPENRDIVKVQQDEIAHLRRLVEKRRLARVSLLERMADTEEEMARAARSLAALRRELSIAERPWPMDRIGMKLEAGRRKKLGL